ncbi:MAG TPA: hypothetical protein HA349_07910 [Methanotrichaceae archaeon]|nr:hypothetical protein [Methanotrichaceae archaeon]
MPKTCIFRRILRAELFFAAILIFSGTALGQSDRVEGPWGERGDVPVAGDFDRDGFPDDIAVFRPSQNNWLFDFDADGDTDVSTRMGPGDEGDMFVVGDFDEDGYVDDVGVFMPSRRWYFGTFSYNSATGTMAWSSPFPSINWGLRGDLPVAGDFDGDGYRDDLGVFRPSNRIWYFDYNSDGSTDLRSGPWAIRGDLPIAGDFNGDIECGDVGVFRSSDRTWYFDYDSNGDTDRRFSPWALNGDLPISGDFDRDGFSDDIGVFRPSTRTWYFKYSDVTWSPPGMTGGPTPGYVNA